MKGRELPDCPHCSAANTLTVVWAEMGTRYCECSCCSKRSRVDHNGEVYRCDTRERRTDVRGNMIEGFDY